MKLAFKLLIVLALSYNLSHSQNNIRENKILLELIQKGYDAGSIKNPSLFFTEYEKQGIAGEKSYFDIGKYFTSVSGIAINNQGTILAAGYEDGHLKLWNMKTGGVIKQLNLHSGAVTALKFSHDDQLLASGGPDNTIRVTRISSGNPTNIFYGATGLTSSLSFSHNGKILASGGMDKTISIWSMISNVKITSLISHRGQITDLDFSPNDVFLASASTDSLIKIWNTESWLENVNLKGHNGAVNTLTFFPDGFRLASGGSDSAIIIWSFLTGQVMKTLTDHKNRVNYLSFGLDGKKLFTGSYDNVIKVWNTDNYELLSNVKCSGVFRAISPDGVSAVLANGEIINVWNIDSSYQISSLAGHSATVSACATSKDNKRAASGSWDKTIKIWDMESGNLLLTLLGHSEGILSLDFSFDGERIVSGGFDKSVKIWAAKNGTLLNSFQEHNNFIWKVAFSPDGSLVAAADWDNTVIIWETATGRLLHRHLLAGSSFAFSPDSKKLVTGGFGLLKIWDVSRGYVLKDLSNMAGDIVSLTYSPDGYRIAAGSIDKSLRILDASSYTLLKNITNLSASVISQAFSPDGSKIVAGGGTALNIYDVYSGNLLQTIDMDLATMCVNYTSDGNKIIVSRDKYLRFYDARTFLTGKNMRGNVLCDGAGLSDVTLYLTGTGIDSSFSDKYGFYSFIAPAGGNYKITPVKKGYTFNPASFDIVNLNNDATINFSGFLNKISISGKVLHNNLPMSNVVINVSAFSNLPETKVTDQNGKYSITLDANKTYTVKPVKNGYSFDPPEKIFFSTSENHMQDFISTKSASLNADNLQIPVETNLLQNYPNPFNPTTNIEYNLASSLDVHLAVYDIYGREIETLVDKPQASGRYVINWEPKNIASGVYYCRLKAGHLIRTTKMIYVR